MSSDIDSIISPDALKGVDQLYERLGKIVGQLDRAAQSSASLDTPLPKYAKGTRSSQAGPAVVGELGRELMIEPSGRMALTGETAHLAMLKAGTKFIPSGETGAIMKAAAASRRNGIEDKIHEDLQGVVDAVRKIRIVNEIRATTGRSITVREGNTWKEYFNRHLQ